MIATDHHGPPKGNSGRGASSLSVSADSAARTSPDLPTCYGGRMSADVSTITVRLERENIDPLATLDPDVKMQRVTATVIDEHGRSVSVTAHDIRISRWDEEHMREKEVPREDGTMGHPDYEAWLSFEMMRATQKLVEPLVAKLTPRDPGRPKKIWEEYGPDYAKTIDDMIGGGS